MLVRIVAAVAMVAAVVVSAAPASAQIADVPGPGQAVSRPDFQCPRTVGCSYEERADMPAGYRFQMLRVCGANCTTQYWVSAIADGKALLEVAPVRGGGLIAVARATDGGGPPAVRTVLPGYGPNDPACCPTSYVETTYTWDAGQGTLVPGDPVNTPVGDVDGWTAYEKKLGQDGFYPVFGGP
jgi:hypothetical protein